MVAELVGVRLTCEDVLNSVGNDEVLVRDQAVDGLLITLWHCRLGHGRASDFLD